MRRGEQRELFLLFKRFVLPSRTVAERGVAQIIRRDMNNEYIKDHFSELVTGSQLRAYEIYLQSQQEAWSRAIEIFLRDNIPEDATRDEIQQFLIDSFELFDSFFLSLTNSRRPRAGHAFQLTIRSLFRRLGYPFEEQPAGIEGKPDFILPSMQYYNQNPMDCIIFTIKRTLRERWRQITTEGTRGLGKFLGTIDNKLNGGIFEEMSRNRIFVVVPLELKEDIPDYNDAQNVMSYETFYEDYLDPAVIRWRRRGLMF